MIIVTSNNRKNENEKYYGLIHRTQRALKQTLEISF